MKNRNIFIIIIPLLIFIFFTDSFSQDINDDEKGIRTIYLIRHGEYDQTDTSDSDVGKKLTPLGIAQTRLLSTRLKGMSVVFTSLISSTMTRARETATVINEDFPELKMQQSTLIRECTPPTFRKDILEEETESDLQKCVQNLEDAFAEFFIPSLDDKDRNDLIVCHGNVIRYFVTKVLKVDTMAWLQMTIGNCSLTIVRMMPNGMMKLISFNDVGHIPTNLQTETGGNNESKKLLLPVEK